MFNVPAVYSVNIFAFLTPISQSLMTRKKRPIYKPICGSKQTTNLRNRHIFNDDLPNKYKPENKVYSAAHCHSNEIQLVQVPCANFSVCLLPQIGLYIRGMSHLMNTA